MIRKTLILLIKVYQKFLSPFCPGVCRYRPTCSAYFIEALQIHGVIKGCFLGIRRILRCHPWGGSGFDPVPPQKESDNKR